MSITDSLKNKYLNKIIVFLLVVYPAIFTYYTNGVGGIISFFEADTFYYLNVLKRSLDLDFYSYDGVYATNGFHPLWQYSIIYISKVLSIHSLDGFIQIVFFTSSLLVGLGSVLIFSVVKNITSSYFLAYISAVPNFYYILFGHIHFSFNSTWSYINGMESPFSFFFLSIILYLLFNKRYLENTTIQKYIFLGILLSFIVLSRLDDIFMVFTFVLYLLITLKISDYPKAFLIGFIPFIVIIYYMYFNYSYSGMLLPVSGGEKFAFTLSNVKQLVNLIYPFIFNVTSDNITYSVWSELSQRQMQMAVPLLISIILYIFIYKKEEITYEDRIFLILSSYVFLKAVYNLFFVAIWHQGHWYYTDSIIISSIIIAYLIFQWFPTKKINIIVNIFLIIYLVILSNSFLSNKVQIHHNDYYKIFYNQKDEIQEILNKNGVNGILELDDGIIGYSLKTPSINAFGFALDKNASIMKKEGKLFDLASSRGYNCFASLVYMRDLNGKISSDDIKLNQYIKSVPFLREQDLSNFHFTYIFRDNISGASFIKFEKIR
jgi:hypothetical protein